ncbi:hypothetical protein AKO1_008026 [Acrasis kona]|uniref:Uncharacterized protein n=1 Tax=Acrasis kona TaxID=1008807 RepID=A0AAW2YQK7_9EUKA
MLVHVPLTSSTPPSSKLIIKDPSALTLPPSPSKSILNNPDPYINRPSKVTKNERRLQKYHRRKEEQLEEEQDKLIRDEAEATEDVSFREHYTVFPEEYNNEFDPTITNWAKMVMREELPSPDQQDEELVQLKNAFAMTASKEEMTIHGSEARRIQASLQAEISQQNIPMLDFNASRYTELMTDFEKGLPITAREQEWAQMATDGIVTQKSLINDLLMWLLSVEPAIRIRFVDYLRLTNHISLVSEIQKQMMRAKVMGANAIQHFREEMRREEWLNSKMIEGHHLVNVDVATQGEHILPALYKMQETHLLYTFPTHIQAEQGVPQHLLATEPMTLEEWRDWADNVTAQIASLDRQRHKYKDTIESIEYLRSQTKGPKKQEFSDGENADAAATTNDDHHQAEPEIESEKNAKKRDRLSQFLTEHPNAEVFDDDYKLDEDSNYPYLHDHNKIPQDMSEDDPIQFKIDLIEKYLQPWMDYRQVTDRTKQQLATDRSSNEEVFPLPDDLRHESTRVFRVPPKRRDHSFPSNAPPARLETSDGKPLQEHKEYEKIINHSEFLDESEFKYSIRPRLLGYPVARRSFYKYDAMLEDVLSNGTYNDRSGYAGTGFDASGNLDEGKQMNAYMDGNPFHDKDRESNQEHIQRPNRGDWFDIDEMAVVDDAYNHPEKQITTFDEFELAMSPFDDVRLDVAIQKRLNLGKHSFAKIKFQEICLKTGRNVVMKPKGKMEGIPRLAHGGKQEWIDWIGVRTESIGDGRSGGGQVAVIS